MKRRPRTAFTLLEALAAVVVLGLLATAVVPMLYRLGDAGLDERLRAQSLLRLLAPPTSLTGDTVVPIPGHPGWSLAVSALDAGPEPPPPAGSAPPVATSHRWLVLRIRNSRGQSLADTLVAVIEPVSP